MSTLEEMEARAQRHLDGMTVNRDVMARDILTLVKAIRAAQKRASQAETTKSGSARKFASYAGVFDEMFGGMFKS